MRWIQDSNGRKLALLSATIVACLVGLVLAIVAFSPTGTEARTTATALISEITPFVASPTATATGVPTTAPMALPSSGAVARMEIPALGINYPVEQLGILPTNELDMPQDGSGKIGWYHSYVVTNPSGNAAYHFEGLPDLARIDSATHVLKPGYGTNSVFSAHESWDFKAGPFKDLSKANPGDLIIVILDDGTQYTYKVFRKQRYDVATMPMGDLIWPKNRPADQEWITLITCGGNFVQQQSNGLGEYTQRDVVVAQRVP